MDRTDQYNGLLRQVAVPIKHKSEIGLPWFTDVA